MELSLPNPVKPGPQSHHRPVPLDRAKRTKPLESLPDNPEQGSLVIIDTFKESSTEASHGNVAAFAARQQGFRGAIYAEQFGGDHQKPQWSRQDSYLAVAQEPRNTGYTKRALQEYSELFFSDALNRATGDLNKIQERGLRDSAVNISLGTSPVRLAKRIYSAVLSAPRAKPSPISSGDAQMTPPDPKLVRQHQFADNIFTAFEIDKNKLFHWNPRVSGPERLKLQQGILSAAEAAAKSHMVKSAQADYAQAVKTLESNNNSVVVSVGNQGKYLDYFAKQANGARVEASPESAHNVLVNSMVTTVGATVWDNSTTERVAEYNSPDIETDIYASGSVGNGLDPNRAKSKGTSYSAPRVAAVMATLHGNHPGMPSSAVENLLRNRLTHETEGESVLNFSAAEEYMRKGTF